MPRVSRARCMAPIYMGVKDDVGNILLNFLFVFLIKSGGAHYSGRISLFPYARYTV
jgi:hypothetical protein